MSAVILMVSGIDVVFYVTRWERFGKKMSATTEMNYERYVLKTCYITSNI